MKMDGLELDLLVFVLVSISFLGYHEDLFSCWGWRKGEWNTGNTHITSLSME